MYMYMDNVIPLLQTGGNGQSMPTKASEMGIWGLVL